MYSRDTTPRRWIILSLCSLAVAFCTPVRADIRLPSIIGDNMVVREGYPAPVWGWADPNEEIRVKLSWRDTELTIQADADGKWVLRAIPPKAGGPYEITLTGKNTVAIKNILAGEVWVCSGQSNMEMPVRNAANAEQEIAAAAYPKIRLFTVARKVAETPQDDCAGKWVECSPETVGAFSAAAYYFGRELHKELDVPVGLIHASWGGTLAEAWTSPAMLEHDLVFEPIVKRYKETLADYPKAQEEYREKLAEWLKDVNEFRATEKRYVEAMTVQTTDSKEVEEKLAQWRKEAREAGTAPPPRPAQPIGPGHPDSPAGLYNGMIAPLIPYAISGAIWYQGESNADRAYQYRDLFPAMIKSWWQAWPQGNFPFLYVQLANWRQVRDEPNESDWAELREAQLMTLGLSDTGMAVTIDIGDANDIHPKNKQDVGKRLALWALAKTYGKDIEYSGPTYTRMERKDNRIILHFDHVGGGLVARDGGPLKGFAIAGADRAFVWADAMIEGDTVVVSGEKVAEPIAVRYAWADNPVCNLYNKAGLPASPFRTDTWSGVTVNNR